MWPAYILAVGAKQQFHDQLSALCTQQLPKAMCRWLGEIRQDRAPSWMWKESAKIRERELRGSALGEGHVLCLKWIIALVLLLVGPLTLSARSTVFVQLLPEGSELRWREGAAGICQRNAHRRTVRDSEFIWRGLAKVTLQGLISPQKPEKHFVYRWSKFEPGTSKPDPSDDDTATYKNIVTNQTCSA